MKLKNNGIKLMKHIKFTESKAKTAATLVSALILLWLVLYSFLGAEVGGWHLLIFIIILILSAFLLLVEGKAPKALSVILFFLLPFASFWLLEGFSQNPWDVSAAISGLNITFFALLFVLLLFALGDARKSAFIGMLIPMIAGIANYFVVSFRSSPIVPWDIYSIRTAVSVADNYEFSMDFNFLLVVCLFFFAYAVSDKLEWKIKKIQWRAVGAAVLLLFGAFYVKAVQTEAVRVSFKLDNTLFTPNYLYRTNGFTVSFLANLQYMQIDKPQGYSAAAVEELMQEVQETYEDSRTANVNEDEREHTENSSSGNLEHADSSAYPNIIVIMNEAFSDLADLGEFGTNEDYMPFIRSLTENTIKGDLYVSVKGGNTASTEFEFLTGDSQAFLPAGSVAYQQYIHQEMPSLASQLRSLGYATAAMHPYHAKGWNRNRIYPDLGFDVSYFRNDFSNAEKVRDYISDRATFDLVKTLYEEKDSENPIFIFDVTMQNHGSYFRPHENFEADIFLTDYEGNADSTERYLTLIRESDTAFEELLEYFSQAQEDTIILMFGDHQPADYVVKPIYTLNNRSLDDLTMEEEQERYLVPFIIWSNFDIEEQEVEQISVNYLSTLLLEVAGIPLSNYQKFLSVLQETIPVITANVYMDADGNFYSAQEADAVKELQDYSILQYNHLHDTKNRIDAYYE